MSIATKTGDEGMTGLMYNRRVAKSHPRVEACGAVDELNAALGMVRATCSTEYVRAKIQVIQKDLITLMGEISVALEDVQRYVRDGFPLLTAEQTAKLDEWVKELEAHQVTFQGWATPGDSLPAATLDVARTVARRAERRVCELREAGELKNAEVVVYLNRLSDLLWLLARWTERSAECGVRSAE
jgi:cob(I)alamin adenosyltransferase